MISASRASCIRQKDNDSTERTLAFIAQNVRGLSATKLECSFELNSKMRLSAVITETKRYAESEAVEYARVHALRVVGGDFNAQSAVRQPDSLVGVRDTVRGPFGIPHVNRAGEALFEGLVSYPRHICAVKPRIDRTLLDDPVLKLKIQNSVVDLIDASQKRQYAALTKHSSQVWYPIRCRLVIRVLNSLPLVCWMLHLNVLQRSTLRW